MNSFRSLDRLFRAAVLGAAANATACSPEASAGTRFNAAGDVDACGGADAFAWGSAFTPLPGVDSVTVRSITPGPFDAGPPTVALLSFGTPCATATDAATCLAAFDALPFTPAFMDTPYYYPGDGIYYDFVATSGDAVTPIVSLAALTQLLAPIDSAPEAALLALLSQRPIGYVLCHANNVRPTATGYEVLVRTGTSCGATNQVLEHRISVGADGTIAVLDVRVAVPGDPNCAIGRLTRGTELAPRTTRRTLGDWLADVAQLEAAAVFAFERLHDELSALGAPGDLVRRARCSVADERRHADRVGTFARRHGGHTSAPRHRDEPRRGAYEIALENAVEGQVRETYGAAVATYQAQHARDPELASLFRTIARDETRHAALSLDLARWLDGRLTDAQRDAVRAARDEAAARFGQALGTEPAYDFADALGLPDGPTSERLFEAVIPRAWTAS